MTLVLVFGLPHVTGVVGLGLAHSKSDHGLEAGRDTLQQGDTRLVHIASDRGLHVDPFLDSFHLLLVADGRPQPVDLPLESEAAEGKSLLFL